MLLDFDGFLYCICSVLRLITRYSIKRFIILLLSVSSTNRIQRLFNNYQKITSIEVSSTQFRSINNDNKKISLLNKINNKVFNFKSRIFRFCRHCDKNYYDNVCSIQKIMLTKIKNEKNEMFNTIELNDIDLKILQTLKFIQTKNVINQNFF